MRLLSPKLFSAKNSQFINHEAVLCNTLTSGFLPPVQLRMSVVQ